MGVTTVHWKVLKLFSVRQTLKKFHIESSLQFTWAMLGHDGLSLLAGVWSNKIRIDQVRFGYVRLDLVLLGYFSFRFGQVLLD